MMPEDSIKKGDTVICMIDEWREGKKWQIIS